MKSAHEGKELQALYEISKILSSSLNLKQNLKNAMNLLSVFMDMKRGTVALKKDGEIAIVAAHGMSEDEIRRGRYRLGEGVMGKVAKLGSPIVIPSVGDEPLFLNKTGARRGIDKQNISFICVPLVFKGEVLGVLSVDRLFGDRSISFETDLRLLKIIASLIAQNVWLNRQVEDEKGALLAEAEELKRRLKARYTVDNMIGISDRMQEVFEAVHRVAPSKATVLLRGESGTGKELVAKAIHYMSERSKGPLIRFNCASIPEGLLESELFGHEKGAFTGAMAMRRGRFEQAAGGTIFLDEIGDLPTALQPKILRVLQEREFERIGGERTIKADVRLVAATSRDLESLVSSGRFREDLYYRLNVVPVFLPPLRERREDIPALAEHFLRRFNKENGKTVAIPAAMIGLFMEYAWPGNVREFENTVERLVVMARGTVASPDDLPAQIREASGAGQPATKGPLTAAVGEMERRRIEGALTGTGWNQARAARVLGLTARQIGYKMKKYGLTRPGGGR